MVDGGVYVEFPGVPNVTIAGRETGRDGQIRADTRDGQRRADARDGQRRADAGQGIRGAFTPLCVQQPRVVCTGRISARGSNVCEWLTGSVQRSAAIAAEKDVVIGLRSSANSSNCRK